MLVMDDTRLLERVATADDGAPEDDRESSRARWFGSGSRRNPVVAIAAGVLMAAAAGLTLAGQGPQRPREASVDTRPPVSAPASTGVAVGSPADVSVQKATYEPGQTSGWHSHTGMHAVMVLSGTLTILDADCRAHTYAAGDTYVGGKELHAASNETAAPVEMTVTYLFPAGRSQSAFHVPAAAPVACSVP